MSVDLNMPFMLPFFLPFFLLSALAAIFWIWMLVDCLTQESSEGNDKLAWTLVILLTNFIGAVIYFFVRRPSRIRMSTNQCVSRHWPLTLSVGLLLAIAASGAILWLFPESSSIVAYLQVKSKPPITANLDQQQRLSLKDFEIFQQTQLALLKSDSVLKSALSRPEISQLDTVIKKGSDPVPWLQKELRVCFPGGGEILEVRYDGKENPEDMKKVIDSVIAAYDNAVLDSNRIKSNETDLAQQHTQVVQPATASENINKAQRYTMAGSLGLAALFLTCMGSVLMGGCTTMRKKHAEDEPN